MIAKISRNFERNVESQRSSGSETLPNLEPRNTSTLNVNSECFQPKQSIQSSVESVESQRGEFVGHSKGHSTMLLSIALVYCQNSHGEVFSLSLQALLDSGSQSNLIIYEAALALKLKCERKWDVCTKSAPYLATRSLKQLAIDDGDKYPLAAKVLMSDVYMNDLLTGADDLESGRKLVSMLKGAGMELHKWSASNPLLLTRLNVSS
ncbi:hypothetical protein TNCV_2455551 [Trichonephila clavipes]|nr:hypothetical protein TNCV_2455551 [Trichonephila clavipes]